MIRYNASKDYQLNQAALDFWKVAKEEAETGAGANGVCTASTFGSTMRDLIRAPCSLLVQPGLIASAFLNCLLSAEAHVECLSLGNDDIVRIVCNR